MLFVAQQGLPAAFENLKDRINTWDAIRKLTDFKLSHVTIYLRVCLWHFLSHPCVQTHWFKDLFAHTCCVYFTEEGRFRGRPSSHTSPYVSIIPGYIRVLVLSNRSGTAF